MASGQPPPNVGLLDVLEQLPRNDLRRSIWKHLHVEVGVSDDSRPGTHLGRPFRLVSRQSRHLANQLTRRLSLSLPTGDDREASLSSQAAFLGRQEGLEHLILDGGLPARPEGEEPVYPENNVELFLLKTLLQGRDALRHLHTLQLNSAAASACSGAVGAAVQLSCPSLRELSIHVHDPAAALFAPLRNCRDLYKIVIASNDVYALHGDVIRTLAALPSLRDLTLSGCMDQADAPLLAGLTGLLQLRAADLTFCGVAANDPTRLGSALGRLTQLTALDVPHWSGSADGPVNAVVAQLGGLHNLADLAFGSIFVQQRVHEGAMAALGRLTALTRLSCPQLSAHLPASSTHLSRLRDLQLTRMDDVSVLAASVQRLLPLPSLRHFRCAVSFVEVNNAPAGDADGAQAAAAWQVAQALAKAPQLQSIALGVCGDWDEDAPGEDQTEASHATGIMSALLLPLQNVLVHLWLQGHSYSMFEGVWPALCLASRLQSLRMWNMEIPESRLLLAVGQNMASLRHVSVMECTGVSGSTVVELARLRLLPLQIRWRPALDAEQRRLIQAAARLGVTLADHVCPQDYGL